MTKPKLNDGSRPWWLEQTLMSRLDQVAEENPDHVFAAYPSSPFTYDHGFREITYGQLANAVNGIAWLVEREVGHDNAGQTLAYVGANDVRYTAIILGAAKAGHKALLISPRNSVAAQFHLFEATGCSTVLSPTPHPPPITAILEERQVRCIGIPSVDELLTTSYKAFNYTKTLNDAKNDAFCVVHTSGSTGMPKPLVWNHQFVSTNIYHSQLPPPPGYENQARWTQGNRVFVTFPPFHGAAIVCNNFNGLAYNTTTVAPISGAITTGSGLVEALKHTKINVAFLVPSIVLDLAQNPGLLEIVSQHIERILYCGGDLPQHIGDIVAAKIPLYNQYGASEQGITPQVYGNRTMADWKYIQPHPKIGAALQYSNDGLYEYTIHRQPEGEVQPAVFSLFPELDAYPSRVLYSHHPTNPDLWQWRARIDDVIVFLNGEKTNPISMEQHISTQNPEVARALVAGSQRFQAALIIQPVEMSKSLTTAERALFIERIWPSVEEANKICPAYARIAKSHIMFTSPEKLMIIAGKGTIQRAGTISIYEKELEKLYTDAEAVSSSDLVDSPRVSDIDDADAVSEFIKKIVTESTDMKSIGPEDNFFALGMDSLQALMILRRLRHALVIPDLALTTIYSNPSIASLTKAVRREAQNDPQDNDLQRNIQEAQKLLEKYRAIIDSIPISNPEATRSASGISVLLTGSTGSLGCHLLDALLSNPSVTAIHCFNRAIDGGRSLQLARLRARGLPTSLASDPRVHFNHVNLTESDFGLSATTLAGVRGSVTHIIHAAWAVDFNMPLAAFDSRLLGLVNLVAFAASSSHRVRYIFVSSISATLANNLGPICEAVDQDLSHLNPIGYGQSKLIGEILLAHASDHVPKSNTEFASVRVGQLAGVAKESIENNVVTWKEAEWFPSLIISSVHVGALPNTLGVLNSINWIPIDVEGQVLVDLALARSDENLASRLTFFQPDNLKARSWENLHGAVLSEVEAITGKTLDIVAPQVWIQMVQQSIERSAEESGVGMAKALNEITLSKLLKLNPAVKLLDMFKYTLHAQQAVYRQTAMAAKFSPTLRDLSEIQDAWIRRWTREWLQSVGYIKT